MSNNKYKNKFKNNKNIKINWKKDYNNKILKNLTIAEKIQLKLLIIHWKKLGIQIM